MTERELSEDYMNSCSVDELASHIVKGLIPATLTFAAEILGHRDVSKKYTSLLLTLLRHPSAIVREGAIYGLSKQNASKASTALAILAEEDPDPGVRIAAKETLESLVDELSLVSGPKA